MKKLEDRGISATSIIAGDFITTQVMGESGSYEVREPAAAYGHDFGPKNGALRLENTYFWNVYHEILMR